MSQACPFCGHESELSEGTPCGQCLGRFARQQAARVYLGEYELFERLGEGATGIVHRGEHRSSGEVVAIKLAKPELVDQPQGAKLFLRQARTESLLRHPHIVGVQGTGTWEGRPFLVMPWMEGGTLADTATLESFPTLEQRLTLLVKIVRAVQFAHERGVLHCDLKPENILFDAAGEPHVSDFGMARVLHEATSDGFHGGTAGYMAPEQVRREPLTTASDVFALGAIVYFLTTERTAFGPNDDDVLTAELPPLPRYVPGLGWGLLAIAFRALEKKPEDRYPAAWALVEDLERLRDNRIIRARNVPLSGRMWCWAERHPGARNAIFLLLPCFALLAFGAASAQHEELREAVLDMNAHSASGQAAAVLYQLREYADIVERAAEDERVKTLVLPALSAPGANPCADRVQLADATPLHPYSRGFATMVVLDAHGCPRARVSEEPPTREFVTRSFDWRDYFGGARADGATGTRRTWVRRAYRSSVSQLMKFAVSTPIFESMPQGQSERRWIGVVTASMTVASTLELPRMRRNEQSDRFTVLIGPFEGEGGLRRRSHADEYAFLAHPKLRRGQKMTIPRELAAELAREFGGASSTGGQFELGTVVPIERRGYRDPFLGKEEWLAAFAPVGGTGYVVLVQTRDTLATRPSLWVWRLGAGLLGCWAVLVASFTGFVVWARAARRGRASTWTEPRRENALVVGTGNVGPEFPS